VKKTVAVLLAAKTSETSETTKIDKPAIASVLHIELAVVDSVGTTTVMKTLASATVAISQQ